MKLFILYILQFTCASLQGLVWHKLNGEIMKKIYVLYKGDEQLAEGTLDELAEKFNVKKKTLLFQQSPTYVKRGKNNRRVLVRVE